MVRAVPPREEYFVGMINVDDDGDVPHPRGGPPGDISEVWLGNWPRQYFLVWNQTLPILPGSGNGF